MNRQPHVMQQIEFDAEGVARFRKNAIVRHLLDAGPFNLNSLAGLPFSDDDREQFAQLIGYSVCNFGELPYAANETVAAADDIVKHMRADRG
jgi:hypothetical protein